VKGSEWGLRHSAARSFETVKVAKERKPMIPETENKQLYDMLRDKDPSLASHLDRIKKRGQEDWMGLLHADEGVLAE
jgi:hypothetical protein